MSAPYTRQILNWGPLNGDNFVAARSVAGNVVHHNVADIVSPYTRQIKSNAGNPWSYCVGGGAEPKSIQA